MQEGENMLNGYRFRLYPNKEQKQILLGQEAATRLTPSRLRRGRGQAGIMFKPGPALSGADVIMATLSMALWLLWAISSRKTRRVTPEPSQLANR